MPGMAPPDQHIRMKKHILGKAVLAPEGSRYGQ
jgi:hypothetical protein